MKSLRKVNKYFYKYRFRFVTGVVFITLSNIFATAQPVVVRQAFNKVELKITTLTLGTDQELIYFDLLKDLAFFGLIIILLALISGFFLFLTRQTIIVTSRLIEYDMKDELYQHLQNLPASFYRKNNTGDIMAKISEDVSKVRMYFGPAVMYGINLIITTIMTIIFMLSVDVELTFYSLIPLPFLSLSIYIISKKIEKKSMALQEGLSDLAIHVQEGMSGIRLIKAFAKEIYHSKEFKIKSKAYKNRALDLTKNNAYFHPLMIAFVGISIVMVLMIGGFQVLVGKITLGNIAEFVMYITRLTWPMTAIGWVTSIIQRAEASQNRINELLEHKNEIVDGEYDVKTFGKKITFKSVYFAYPDEPQKWVLEDLNLIIEKGKSLGIIGPIGSGKTTILQLLMRCYDVSSGGIFLDEHNIKDLKVSSLRKLIGYVPQDVFLFSDTIENNILFGLENKENANLENAIFIANLDQAISLFPHGLKSMLGERGINLSGGQKQRTAIARALIREPEILLLDDCLSAVDTHTEHQILQRLKEVLKGKTTIITSHRVSAVKLADQIAVLNEGKIVEMGSHEELLKLNGKYKAIYDKQTTIETEVIINK